MVIEEDRRQTVARVAAASAARAGDPALEPQIAYCLAVLTAKRRFRLDPETGVAEQLAALADGIARHLREWGARYDAIQDELDRFETTTIRRFIPVPERDSDVVDVVADRLADVIAGGPPTAEMTLALAYEDPPLGSAYVFQSPLRAWILASTRVAHKTSQLDEGLRDAEHDGVDEILARAEALDEQQLRDVVERVAEHLSTRELLASLIDRADRFEVEVARMRPASRSHSELLVRLRAEIVAITDQLLRERRALRDMLAYTVLAMGKAVNVQTVMILSLRTASIAPDAVAEIAATMHGLLTDETQPTPSLIARAERATHRGVPRQRIAALEGLDAHPHERGERLAGVGERLERLPPVVGDDMASIAAAMPVPSTAAIVKQNRNLGRVELGRVDRWFVRVLNRYTRGPNDR